MDVGVGAPGLKGSIGLQGRMCGPVVGVALGRCYLGLVYIGRKQWPIANARPLLDPIRSVACLLRTASYEDRASLDSYLILF